MEPAGDEPQPLDARYPNPARMRNHWLGGKDTYSADRDAGDRIQAALPQVAECAVRGRLFLARAVQYAARCGAPQVIDLRCGYPVPPWAILPDSAGRPVKTELRDSHRAARDGAGDSARCAYVDDDPVVLTHVAGLLAEPGRVAAVHADWRDPAAVLSSPSLAAVIDLGKPVTVALGMALHHVPAAQAREITGAYLDAVPPGSFLAVSVLQVQADVPDEAVAAWPGRVWFHSPAEVASFAGGTVLVEPGLVTARSWRPGWQSSCMVPDGPVWALAGVGRKP